MILKRHTRLTSQRQSIHIPVDAHGRLDITGSQDADLPSPVPEVPDPARFSALYMTARSSASSVGRAPATQVPILARLDQVRNSFCLKVPPEHLPDVVLLLHDNTLIRSHEQARKRRC